MQSSSSSERNKRREELEELAAEIRACRRCPLHAGRTKAVPGEGDPYTRIVFVGEAPGFNEDLQGRPFVGAAGQLLSTLLGSIGLTRESVFITNVVKCRPPGNRDPADEEIQACLPFLKRQLEVIQPTLIVTLGRHSTRTLLGLHGIAASSIMAVRGEIFRLEEKWGTVLLFPTLHPAAALYNPRLRGLLEKDFKKIARHAGGSGDRHSGGQSTLDLFLDR